MRFLGVKKQVLSKCLKKDRLRILTCFNGALATFSNSPRQRFPFQNFFAKSASFMFYIVMLKDSLNEKNIQLQIQIAIKARKNERVREV